LESFQNFRVLWVVIILLEKVKMFLN